MQQNVTNYNGEDFVYFKQGIPIGVSCEILSLNALKEVHKHYKGTAVAQYIRENPHEFDVRLVVPETVYLRPEYRIALDVPEDYALCKRIYDDIGADREVPVPTKEVLLYLDDNPEVALLNKNFVEKNVNQYGFKLEHEPVFKVYMDDDGDYFVVGRTNNSIPYERFITYVSDTSRWRIE